MIQITDVSKKFNDHVIFQHFTETIYDQEFVAITGSSGKGKTTLINMIGGLDSLDAGDITINGIRMNKKNRLQLYRHEIAFLFQNFALVDDWSVKQNLEVALAYQNVKDKPQAIGNVLEKLGLQDKQNHNIYTLSGGEQQRVALARIMLQDHKIILADEPTGSLDEANRDMVFTMLKDMQKAGKTIVMVTHDRELAGRCDRVITL